MIALVNPNHSKHRAAVKWFRAIRTGGWATCSLTEAAVLRILGNSNLPNALGHPAHVAHVLRVLCDNPEHHFWLDDVSPIATPFVDTSRLLRASQVTDTQLLALAARHDGKLATFDERLDTSAVPNGANYLHEIE